MLPSWQLLFPNKSLQAFFLPEIDVVSQNCKTQNTPLTLRVIPEQLQTPPGISFRTLLTSITSRWRCYPYSALYRPYWFERHGFLKYQWMPYRYIVLPGLYWISQVSDVCARHSSGSDKKYYLDVLIIILKCNIHSAKSVTRHFTCYA